MEKAALIAATLVIVLANRVLTAFVIGESAGQNPDNEGKNFYTLLRKAALEITVMGVVVGGVTAGILMDTEQGKLVSIGIGVAFFILTTGAFVIFTKAGFDRGQKQLREKS